MRNRKAELIAGVVSVGLALAGLTAAARATDLTGAASGCLVARDVPFHQVRPDGVAPTDIDRHIPGRATMQDPCAIRLLR